MIRVPMIPYKTSPSLNCANVAELAERRGADLAETCEFYAALLLFDLLRDGAHLRSDNASHDWPNRCLAFAQWLAPRICGADPGQKFFLDSAAQAYRVVSDLTLKELGVEVAGFIDAFRCCPGSIVTEFCEKVFDWTQLTRAGSPNYTRIYERCERLSESIEKRKMALKASPLQEQLDSIDREILFWKGQEQLSYYPRHQAPDAERAFLVSKLADERAERQTKALESIAESLARLGVASG